MSSWPVLVLLSSAMAQEAPPIVGGELTGDYPEAVFIWRGVGSCTGTLVAPSWVLTAAHCLTGISASQVQVYIGQAPADGDFVEQLPAQALHIHPGYLEDLSAGLDVGLVQLKRPADAAAPSLVTRRPVDDSWDDRPLRYVGFGVTSEDAEDAGEKRTLELPFYHHDERWMYTYESGENFCWGDSGGPALVETPAGRALSGVISWVGGEDSELPCSAGWGASTRLDTVLPWVEQLTPLRFAEDLYEVEDTGLGDSGLDAEVQEQPLSDTAAPLQGEVEAPVGACSTAPGGGAVAGLAGLLLLGWRRRRA